MSSVLLLLAVNHCLLAREQVPRSFELFTNVQEKIHNILVSEDSECRAQVDGPKCVDERMSNIKINEAPSVAPLASSATVSRARYGSHKTEKIFLEVDSFPLFVL